ncbi:MAG: hypothetical protein J6O73_14175 [Lachnospiraceae bacterium]|nr:hypothetical protein [Lachnospiraceae bacterium]
MILKKIIILLISIAVPIFLLSSCASPDNVKLSDSVGAVKYVEENFGNAELIGTNTNSVSIVYTFRDEEYGFEYSMRSFASGNSVDGEVTSLEEQYHFDFLWYGGTSADVAGTLVFDDKYISNVEQASEKIAKLMTCLCPCGLSLKAMIFREKRSSRFSLMRAVQTEQVPFLPLRLLQQALQSEAVMLFQSEAGT